jgi:O-antigen/teichoic acid export membrane protein
MSSNANNVSNNKRIAKNTLIMYIRMLLVMAITLITVRFVLKTLGVEDYGIYNVVAGFVVSMSFISSSMQMATQRFYAYSIGEHNTEKLQKTFNTSLFIYFIIVLIIALLAESVGLWFLYHKMVIPESRFVAAVWIYQFAVASFVISMLATPFSAMIIAHEDMGIYAFVSLTDCVLKLLILSPIALLPYDRLIFYGGCILAVTLIKEGINVFYSRRHYPECKFVKVWDKKQFQSILSYSGWSLFGTSANIAYNQGNNILINLFFGPVANAAQAVAFQVSGALSMFSSNFYAVIRPPLIKSYAEGNYEYMMRLFYTSAKITFCLLLLIFLPLILNTEYILNLWLDNVGDYMVAFSQLTLIASIILAMHQPITTIIQATGSVKRYHVIVETSTLLILPLTYVCFKYGYSVVWAFYISIAMFLIAHIIRLLVLRTVIAFSLREYVVRFVLPMLLLTIISTGVTYFIHKLLANGFFNLTLTCMVAALSVTVCCWWLTFSKAERTQVVKMITKRG